MAKKRTCSAGYPLDGFKPCKVCGNRPIDGCGRDGDAWRVAGYVVSECGECTPVDPKDWTPERMKQAIRAIHGRAEVAEACLAKMGEAWAEDIIDAIAEFDLGTAEGHVAARLAILAALDAAKEDKT